MTSTLAPSGSYFLSQAFTGSLWLLLDLSLSLSGSLWLSVTPTLAPSGSNLLSQAFTGSLWLLLDLSLSLSGSLWFSVTLAITFEIEGMVYFCPKNKTGSQMDVSFQIGDLYTQ